MKEQAKVESKPEIKDKARGEAEPGSSNLEGKAGQSIQVKAGPQLEATSLVDQPPGAAVTEKKASTAEVASKEVKDVCGDSDSYQLGNCNLFWAYYLTMIGGGLTCLCFCLSFIASSSKKHRYSSV